MNNTLKLEGFVDIDIINKKTKEHKHYHNTITDGGKKFLLKNSVAKLLEVGGDTFGKLVASSTLGRDSVGWSSSNYAGYYNRSDRALTNCLLYLDTEISQLTAAHGVINIWDDDFASKSKLVGYANSNIGTLALNEGALVDCKDEYTADMTCFAKRWKYDAGVASGTIDTVAMMCGDMIFNKYGDAVCLAKLLDRVNVQDSSYGSLSSGFLIPGVSNYTDANTIFLNFTKGGKNRWAYNILTGEITEVAAGAPFFVVNLYESGLGYLEDMKYLNGYLYVLRSSSVPSYTSSYRSVCLSIYDVNNNMTTLEDVIITDRFNSINNKLLYINNVLYVTSWASLGNSNSSGTNNRLYVLSKGSAQYFHVIDTSYTDYTYLGFTVPTGLDINAVGLGNYGSNYVVYVSTRAYTDLAHSSEMTSDYFGYKSVGYVCSDITDPFNSLLDIIPGITPGAVLFSASTNKGMLRIGFDRWNSYINYDIASQSNLPYDPVDVRKYFVNTDNPSLQNGTYLDIYMNGLFYTPDGDWFNVLSYVKLETPVTKGSDDVLYVSYGYKVV